MGKTRLRLREYPEALAAFEKALTADRAEKETAPLAWYNIGLIYEQQGAKDKAREAFGRMLKLESPPTISREARDARRRL
jgi:tetratricopeptide (TPR) repeat protein